MPGTRESTGVPRHVQDTIAALQAERQTLGARLDALDLALENLRRVWPTSAPASSPSRRLRIVRDQSSAGKRRDVLLAAIAAARDGLALKDLRAATPKMRGKDRSNALHKLKALKQIRRAGKLWVAA